ncbi:MAG: hypothetical protein NVSMB27_14380 [Ktedonobacteraceae bacterium]
MKGGAAAEDRNISGVLTYHTTSGVLLRPFGTQADENLPTEDLDVYKIIAQKCTEIGVWNTKLYDQNTPLQYLPEMCEKNSRFTLAHASLCPYLGISRLVVSKQSDDVFHNVLALVPPIK